MTKATSSDETGETCSLSWEPGTGGLWARVRPEWVPPVDPPPDPGTCAIPRGALHVTLLRTSSMLALVAPLGPAATALAAALPRPPRPSFRPVLYRAVRAADPVRDARGEARPRSTWFVVVEDQGLWHCVLAEIVTALDVASRTAGGPPFFHPEQDRLFHLSLFNDRGGDPRRSIGDVSVQDL